MYRKGGVFIGFQSSVRANLTIIHILIFSFFTFSHCLTPEPRALSVAQESRAPSAATNLPALLAWASLATVVVTGLPEAEATALLKGVTVPVVVVQLFHGLPALILLR